MLGALHPQMERKGRAAAAHFRAATAAGSVSGEVWEMYGELLAPGDPAGAPLRTPHSGRTLQAVAARCGRCTASCSRQATPQVPRRPARIRAAPRQAAARRPPRPVCSEELGAQHAIITLWPESMRGTRPLLKSQEIARWPATVPDGAAGAAEALRAYKRALQLHHDAAEADVGKRRKAARRARATRARAALANGVADGGAGEDPALATVRGRGASGLAALRQMVLGLLPIIYSLRLWAPCCTANLICVDALHLKPCRCSRPSSGRADV